MSTGAASLNPQTDRVCAVVVTFNRKTLLTECLKALQAQPSLDHVLVVDNASTDGTRALLEAQFPDVEVLSLSRNGGGAGGFYAGMKQAFEAGYDWLWIMDDDGKPAPDCLQKLLEKRPAASGKPCVLVPIQRDQKGRVYGIGVWDKIYVDVSAPLLRGEREMVGDYLFAFVGPLISREVVKRIGLPRREFFIWFDDYEYGLRLHRSAAKSVIVVPEAVFYHDVGGKTREVRVLGRKALRNESPAWKTYYGTRNHLFTVLRTRRSWRELVGFAGREGWLLIGDLIFEPDRWTRARLRLRGLSDGTFGRMGKRV